MATPKNALGKPRYVQELRRSGKTTRFYRRGAFRVKLPDTDFSSDAFRAAYFAAENEWGKQDHDAARQAKIISSVQVAPWHDYLSRLSSKASARAKAKDIPFDISAEYILGLFDEQKGVCAVSGLPFSIYEASSRINPYQPSLDRVTPSSGYVHGNCRLVLYAVNLGMSDFWLSDYARICRAVAKKHKANSVAPLSR